MPQNPNQTLQPPGFPKPPNPTPVPPVASDDTSTLLPSGNYADVSDKTYLTHDHITSPRPTIPPVQTDILPKIVEITGRYVNIEGAPIQKGGLGKVTKVRDLTLGRVIARKELLPHTQGHAPSFVGEARLTAQLEHPNIVPIYEQGVNSVGQPYYTMKFIDGKTLEDALLACKDLDARLKLLGHFVDLCQAVAFAHSKNVIHRDLKPQNVMVGAFGETILLDWGLAQPKGESDITGFNNANKEAPGSIRGTVSYMSPEQARGEQHHINKCSDIWALGAILYRLLANNPPHGVPYDSDEVRAILNQAATQAVPDLQRVAPQAPPELAAIAMKALAFEPAQRYASAKELAEEIEAWQNNSEVKAYHYSLWEGIKLHARRNPAAYRVGAVLSAALLSVIVLSLFQILQHSALAQQNLAAAYAEQARSALLAHRVPEAKDFAIKSLEQNTQQTISQLLFGTPPLPAARGAFLDAASSWSPQLRYKGRLISYDIRQTALSSGGAVAFATRQGLLRWSPLMKAPQSLLAPKPRTASSAVRFLSDDVLSVISGRKHIDFHNGKPVFGKDLGAVPEVALMAQNGDSFIVGENSLRRQDANGHDIWPPIPAVSETRGDTLALSPDESLLAWGHRDGTLHLFNATTGALLPGLNDRWVGTRAMVFSPDSRLLVTAGSEDKVDKSIQVWDLSTNQLKTTFSDCHQDMVSALAFSPDGRILVSGGKDWALCFLDIQNNTYLARRALHRARIATLSFAPADPKQPTRLLSTATNGEISLWEFPDTVPPFLTRASRTPKGALSLDGQWLLTSTMMGVIQLSKTLDGTTVFTRNMDAQIQEARLVTLNQNAQILAWTEPDGDITLHFMDEDVDHSIPAKSKMLAMALSADGTWLVAADVNGILSVWESRSGQRLWSTDVITELGMENKARVLRLSFSPNGQHIAVTSELGLSIYDAKTGQLEAGTPEIQGSYVADWHPDGQSLIVSDAKHLLHGFHFEKSISDTWSLMPYFTASSPHEEHINQVCFLDHAEVHAVVSISRDRSLRFWDPKQGQELARIDGNEFFWLGCDNTNGQVIAASTSGEVQRWDTRFLMTPVAQLRQEVEATHLLELTGEWLPLQLPAE